MPFISVTRLRVRSHLYLPAFLWRTFQSLRQAERSPGFLRGQVMREAGNTFWTTTAWEDAGTMDTFRTSGAHRAAMPKLLSWCDEASVVHWNQETAQLPTWLEAHQRMVGEGRLSKVNHPSPAQSAGKLPAPQPGRVQRTLKPAGSPRGSAAP